MSQPPPDPGQQPPPQHAQPGAAPYGGNPYGGAPYAGNPYGGAPGFYAPAPPDHPQATTVLVLGILGLAACGVVAPFAWVIGGRAKREIDASGGRLGGRQQVQIGYVLGIVGSVFLILGVLGFLAYIAVAIAFIGAGA